MPHLERVNRGTCVSNTFNERSVSPLLTVGAELSLACKSYSEVEIPKGAVVYCDPPYANTAKYLGDFDHAAFYEWLRTRDFPVYISEYGMPEDFQVIVERTKRGTLSATANNKVVEKMFVHKRWVSGLQKNYLFDYEELFN